MKPALASLIMGIVLIWSHGRVAAEKTRPLPKSNSPSDTADTMIFTSPFAAKPLPIWIEFVSTKGWYIYDDKGIRARSPGHTSITLKANVPTKIIARTEVFGSIESNMTWDGVSTLSFATSYACNYDWDIKTTKISNTHYRAEIRDKGVQMSCSGASALSRDRYKLNFKSTTQSAVDLWVLFDDGENWAHHLQIEPGGSVNLSLPITGDPEIIYQSPGHFDCAKQIRASYKNNKLYLIHGNKEEEVMVNPPAGTGALSISCPLQPLPK